MYHPFTFNYLPSCKSHQLSPFYFPIAVIISPFFPIPLIISLYFRFHQLSPFLSDSIKYLPFLSDSINYLPIFFQILLILSPSTFSSYQLYPLLFSITPLLFLSHQLSLSLSYPIRDRRDRDRMVCRPYHHKNCEFESSSWRGVFDTTSRDKVCQWHVTSRWFSPGTQVSSTYKTDRHDITEIVLKLTLNTISLSYPINYLPSYQWQSPFKPLSQYYNVNRHAGLLSRHKTSW